jgi:hypothetical protein
VTIPASNVTGTLQVNQGGTGATTLTGYVKGAGTTALTASSTIPNTDITGLGTASTRDAGSANGVATLDAGGKVPVSELPAAVLGALSYQGTWNASTNTPTLTSSTGTKGYYYVVSVAGNTNLDGITDWLVGDWAVYNGTVWQKVDNTETVTSVNGQTGAVVLTTTNIAEGTNLYYTDARARASVSAGTGISYVSGTGVITNSAPDQTVVLNAGTGISTSGTYPNFTITNTSPSLGGDVVGPASATDNAVARFDSTTGKLLQNSVVLVGDTGVVTGVTELTASTKVVSPHFDAQNSAGGQLRNASGTPQIQWGGGGGNNVSVDVAINLNPANSQVDLSPTGTGTVRINPATASSMNNVVIGATTPLAITGTTITGTSFVGSGASLTNVVNSLTASTGISVSGSTGAVTVTNTAPDQTVAISSGTGISVSGTYPNFTVTNTAPSSGGTVTSVTGTAPIASSGGNTPAISISQATTSTDGYLSSTDWNTFNGKLTNPMNTLGDVIYGASSGTATRLAGNTTTNKYFLSQTGTGSASAAPSWSTLPTVLPVLNRAGATVSVAVGNGVLPVLNRAGSTVNVAIN